MDEQSIFQPPHVVARELDISSATLRRWSDEFADYLSREAGSADGRSHRRYTQRDLSTLSLIKQLMNNGMTYEQVRQELTSQVPPVEPAPSAVPLEEMDAPDIPTFEQFRQTVPDEDEDDEFDQQKSLVAAPDENSAMAFLANTIAGLSDGQKSILNSQAANRELLGVLIQDNFNLKEENNRLRERILEVERNLAQVRQEDEWRREGLRRELESKIAQVQQTASEALVAAQNVEMPEIKAVKTKSGCLGALFGGGETQIVTVPRRRGRGEQGVPSRGGSSRPVAPQPPLPSEPPPAHPKPFYPPE
jgi:DNA-binding transcriptional MerR regulator